MSIVGIDFGDENLTIACVRNNGVDVLFNDIGKRKTPSAFSCHHVSRQIGTNFSSQFQANASNSVTYLKRLVGKKFSDPIVAHEQKFMYCKLVSHTDADLVGIQVKHRGQDIVISPEQGVAILLKNMKKVYADSCNGENLISCTIAVPPYFNNHQRVAMENAAHIASIPNVQLINDITAVALQYGTGRSLNNEKRRIIFFDMGVTSISVSRIVVGNQSLEVESYAYDNLLGGRDFDELLTSYMASQIEKKYKINPFKTTKSIIRLRREADRVKQILSANTQAHYTIEYLVDDVDVSGIILRSDFEYLIEKYYKDRILKPLMDVLDGVDPARVHSLELLGGSTRIPYIHTLLRGYFGRDLSRTCDADEAVCRGASFRCLMASPAFKGKPYRIRDLTPHIIQLCWSSNPKDIVTIFGKFNKIPSSKTALIKTAQQNFQLLVEYKDPEDGTNTNTKTKKEGEEGEEGEEEMGEDKSSPTTTPASISDSKIPLFQHEKIACPSPPPTFKQYDGSKLVAKVTSQLPDSFLPPLSVSCGINDSGIYYVQRVYYHEHPNPQKNDPSIPADYTITTQPPTEEDLVKFKEQEIIMTQYDEQVRLANEARNTLEGYILQMRPIARKNWEGKASGDKFITACNETEEWLDDADDSITMDTFNTKLQDLKNLYQQAEISEGV